MATVHKCDRCGKEIVKIAKTFTSKHKKEMWGSWITERIDLCEDCFKMFQEWLKGATR